MEQEGPKNTPFPRPPPFYQQFTVDNITALELLRKTWAEKHGEEAEFSLIEAPSHLQYLCPPPLPTDGHTAFGEDQGVSACTSSGPKAHTDICQPAIPVPALPEDVRRLVPEEVPYSETPDYLLRITRSLLLNYLELVGALSQDPDYAKPKTHDLKTLLLNAHRLLNEYRPHQARESLITMMEEQLQRKRDEVAGVVRMTQKVNALLASFGDDTIQEGIDRAGTGISAVERAQQHQATEQRAVWRALEAMDVA